MSSGSALAAPPNDTCASATAIANLPFAETIDVSTATSEASDPGLPCLVDFDAGTRSVWYRFTASSDVALDIGTQGSTCDTTIAVHPDACGTLGPFQALACVDDDLLLAPQSRAFVAVDQGETVLIEVVSPLGDGPSLSLHVRNADEGQPAQHGPEFVVNTYTTGDQGYYFFRRSLSVCSEPDGDFVVVWQSDDSPGPSQDGDLAGIFAQRYDAAAVALGGELQVNEQTTGAQEWPTVACDPNGGFVVAWENGVDTVTYGVRARRFDAAGSPVTGDIVVATGTQSQRPSLGVEPSGTFLIAWDDTSTDILARRFDASGLPLGAAFEVNETASDQLVDPDVAVNAGGTFVVTWENETQDEIRARRLDAMGAFMGSELTVNGPGSTNEEPSASINSAGNFVVTWRGRDEDNYKAIRARFFDSGATPGPVVKVNDVDDENVVTSDVILDSGGNFVVVWEDYLLTKDVLGRRFRADGTPIGDVEFQVNTVREYTQHAPHAAPLPGGDFVVVWVGYDGYDDGAGYFAGGYGVRAQRLHVAPQPPCPPAARSGCKQPTANLQGRLTLRDRTPDASDSLSWTWLRGEATALAEMGDPLATHAYSLCLYDGTNTLRTQAVMQPGGTCGSTPCWKGLNAGFRYRNAAGTPDGIQKAVLKAGSDGKAKVLVKGKGVRLGMPVLPLAVPVRVQLASASVACWEAEFQSAGVIENTTSRFSARAHAD